MTPEDNLVQALSVMEQSGIAVISRSQTWVTAPVPASDQPDYRNAVAVVETALEPHDLLDVLLQIERDFGRVRGDERNAARTLDLDILAYEDRVIADERLDIPHPRLQDRAFVLGPLVEIAPYWKHPVLDQTAADMLRILEEQA